MIIIQLLPSSHGQIFNDDRALVMTRRPRWTPPCAVSILPRKVMWVTFPTIFSWNLGTPRVNTNRWTSSVGDRRKHSMALRVQNMVSAGGRGSQALEDKRKDQQTPRGGMMRKGAGPALHGELRDSKEKHYGKMTRMIRRMMFCRDPVVPPQKVQLDPPASHPSPEPQKVRLDS